MKTKFVGILITLCLLGNISYADSCDGFLDAAKRFMRFNGENGAQNGCVNVTTEKTSASWGSSPIPFANLESAQQEVFKTTAGNKESLRLIQSLSDSSHKRAVMDFGFNPMAGNQIQGQMELNTDCKITKMIMPTPEGEGYLEITPQTCAKVKRTRELKVEDENSDQVSRSKALSPKDVYGKNGQKFAKEQGPHYWGNDKYSVVRACDAFATVLASEPERKQAPGGAPASQLTTAGKP